MRESVVLEGVAEEAYRRQARGAPGGIQVHDMREGLLFPELANDPHLHVPQVEARRDGHYPVFLVTTGAVLARAAVLCYQGEPPPEIH